MYDSLKAEAVAQKDKYELRLTQLSEENRHLASQLEAVRKELQQQQEINK